jgi:hypothetical protein
MKTLYESILAQEYDGDWRYVKCKGIIDKYEKELKQIRVADNEYVAYSCAMAKGADLICNKISPEADPIENICMLDLFRTLILAHGKFAHIYEGDVIVDDMDERWVNKDIDSLKERAAKGDCRPWASRKSSGSLMERYFEDYDGYVVDEIKRYIRLHASESRAQDRLARLVVKATENALKAFDNMV